MHDFLSQHLWYYLALPKEQQARFQTRVSVFMANKRFSARQELKIDERVKWLVSGIGVMVGFGLKEYMLPHFRQIILYPEAYFSLFTKRMHNGEVNLKGAIVLSLKDVIKGLQDPQDGINTGIHEFAHAFYFENVIENQQYGFFHPDDLHDLFAQSAQEIADIRQGYDSIFREYAATNKQEFFAVATELFFECPQLMKDRLPKLYRSFVNIYKQDPLLIKSQVLWPRN